MKYMFLFVLLYAANNCFATGLLMPEAKNYPKDFLKLRSSKVTVNINGLTAETIVYQEFENEWSDSTDAVYSFPLPEGARATDVYYWYKDKLYKAVLKVKEQSTNPGTGEGGVAALVNSYIGANGIKIEFKGIQPGTTQKIELHYVSICDYYKGNTAYTFPLNTVSFLTYPIDNVEFNINIKSSSDIKNFSIPSFIGYKTNQATSKDLTATMQFSKFYLDKDFSFKFETFTSSSVYDFYSNNRDTTGGHFVLYTRPQDTVSTDSVIRKNVVFLISNSSNMIGSLFSTSIRAISNSLDKLSPNDKFNIITFNYNNSSWQSSLINATSANIAAAKTYLAGITQSYGSDLNYAIKVAFNQFTDSAANNIILAFCESNSNADPKSLEALNKYKTGIFPIAVGSIPDRSRLEMTAELNYGFVTYLMTQEEVSGKIERVIAQVSKPLLKDVRYEFGGSNITSISPSKLPSVYAGSAFYITGRYKKAGNTPLSIAGTTVSGVYAIDVMLNFENQQSQYLFTETLWAKNQIDELERQIAIYGETAALKQQLIDLSLKYNIRCRYTAYIADYSTTPTGVQKPKPIIVTTSYIAGNYPNPFNPTTRIRFYISGNDAAKLKFLKIYNVLGQLVAVIDITGYGEGWHEAIFNANNAMGASLSSGIYFARLQIGEAFVNTIRLNLIK